MSYTLDELVNDYVDYSVTAVDDKWLTFTQWCNDPVLCDQELLAESGLAEFVFQP